jgi:hypothetical protein
MPFWPLFVPQSSLFHSCSRLAQIDMNPAYQKERQRQEASKLRLGDLMVAFMTAGALAMTVFMR